MRYFPFKHFVVVMAVSASVGCVAALAQAPNIRGMGRAPTPEELAVLDKGAGPSGKDLPPGKGTAKQGAPIFAVKCAMCHGRDAEGNRAAPGSFSPLSGGRLGGGTNVPLWNAPHNPDGTPRITTLDYYSPWATSIWNTIAVEMPFFRAGTLTPDEAYALTAFILFKNGLLKEDEVMDRETLPKVRLPNRDAFVPNRIEDLQDWDKRGCRLPYGVCP